MTCDFSKPFHRRAFRRALVLALTASTAGFALAATPASAKDASATPKITLSAKFQPVYIPLAKKIEADKTRPDILAAQAKVKAATDDASRSAATAELAGLLAGEKSDLATATAAATSADDHYVLGQLEYQLAGIAMDSAMQRQGVEDMLASGKVAAADIGKFQFSAGYSAYLSHDYPDAITSFKAAIAAGYDQNDVNVLLADCYLKTKQVDKGLPALQAAIDHAKAAGETVPAQWYEIGLVASYNGQLVAPALSFGRGLILLDPSKKNWELLLQVVRAVAHYPTQDELDLMRLMGRTNSYADKQDYLEYIQDADPRRLPGEVLDVIAAGEASGMLSAGEPSIADAKAVAGGRVVADKASLPGLERDARAPSATAVTASAAGDAFLSYGRAADAVAMYQIALAKPGVDTDRVLNRLGIAQIDSGDYAGAQATLAKITGPRQPLAQLWSIYAAEKAAGK